MTETEQRIAALAAHPPRARRTWQRVVLTAGSVLLTLIAVTSLVLGVANAAVQNSNQACQAKINQQYRTDATKRAEITTEDRVALDKWISSVGTILTSRPEDSLQQLIAATESYTETRRVNDERRKSTPLDALTGRC